MRLDLEACARAEALRRAEQQEERELAAAVGPCATCGHSLLAHEVDGCAVNSHGAGYEGDECDCIAFVAP